MRLARGIDAVWPRPQTRAWFTRARSVALQPGRKRTDAPESQSVGLTDKSYSRGSNPCSLRSGTGKLFSLR